VCLHGYKDEPHVTDLEGEVFSINAANQPAGAIEIGIMYDFSHYLNPEMLSMSDPIIKTTYPRIADVE